MNIAIDGWIDAKKITQTNELKCSVRNGNSPNVQTWNELEENFEM